MKITRLRVRRFRGFHADFSLELPQGENVLLYGDNGSGKSSIASAVRHLLVDAPRPISPHRNIFSDAGEEAEVEISYSNWPDPNTNTLRWDAQGHPLNVAPLNRLTPVTRAAFRNAVSRSAFIDYRDLLKTSGSRDKLPQEFFHLVAGTLLRSVPVDVDGRATTIGALYDSAMRYKQTLRNNQNVEWANRAATALNQALQGKLGPLETKVAELLPRFENLFTTVRFDYSLLRWPNENRGNRNTSRQGGTLTPIATFKGAELDHSPAILNEARLTALAICIFFAGVLISDIDSVNPDHPRLIVLDDGLISMDANNRKPVLEILQTAAFQHFQIILLTHDSVWFDVARKQLSGWKVFKLVTEQPERADEASVPLFLDLGHGGPASDLDIAEIHLNRDDKPAAAVYARSAFERKLKKFAEENHLRIPFQIEVKRVTADTLWTAVKTWNAGLTNRHIPIAIVTSIDTFRSDVLNELSHSEPRNWDRSTIQAALTTLRQFCLLSNRPPP